MLLHTKTLISELMTSFERGTYIRTVLPTSSVTLVIALVRHKYNLKYTQGKHLSQVLAQDRKTKDDSQKQQKKKEKKSNCKVFLLVSPLMVKIYQL